MCCRKEIFLNSFLEWNRIDYNISDFQSGKGSEISHKLQKVFSVEEYLDFPQTASQNSRQTH